MVYDRIMPPVDTLRAVLEIGEQFGDSTCSFGILMDARIDDRGRILVLDELGACLKVFDIEGNYIQQVSGRGSGPGESRNVKGLFVMPDGRVGIMASDKKGYVVFDDSLRFVEEIGLWMQDSPYHATALSDSLLVMCRYDGSSESQCILQTVSIYRWGEPEWQTLLWKDSMEVGGSYPGDPSAVLRFALLDRLSTGGVGDGIVYFAPGSRYEYRVFGWDSTGRQVLSITRELAPVEKCLEQIDYEIFYTGSSLQRRSTGHRPLPFEYQPEPYRGMVLDVGIGPDSNLWVRRGTCNEPFFDIYDLEGNLLRHAIYPDSAWDWQTEVTLHGVLAWELDPLEGYQKLYLLE
ncbi:6-bladed beta-propeller [Candidatus Fermentibacterales bacterium]|nr:6-bladed beta-propeller [Candidatus Fermentibacterales bacterium]